MSRTCDQAGSPVVFSRNDPRRRSRGRRRRNRAIALASLALGLAALGITCGGRILDEATRIRAVEVRIEGAEVVSVEELRDLLAIRPGSSLRSLEVEHLRQRLLAMPRIAGVRFGYVWFQRLVVEVAERVPVAMVISSEGESFEIAMDGIVLPPAGEGVADLPLLTWEEQPGTRPAPGALLDLRGGPDLMHTLRDLQERYPSLWQGISEAHLLADGTYELFWNDTPTVAWGRGALSDARLRAWATIMSDLHQRGEKDAVVDLRFREQIVVRLPEGAGPSGAPLG